MKLPHNAEITPEFVNLMIDIYKAWLERVMQIPQAFGMAGNTAINVKRVLPIVRRQSPDLHTGLDYEITRLRQAAFSKFYATKFNGTRYLVGITRHITLVAYDNRARIEAELGPYRIYLSEEMFAQADLRLIHMLPERNPRTVYRHPHHYVDVFGPRTSKWAEEKLPSSTHPLLADTGNCWGDVNSPAKSSIDDPDIPDLFRLLHYHLTTRGYIPPIHVDFLDFDHTTPEEK